jgi:hypothetical protein
MKCKECGEENPDKFYTTSITLCKECKKEYVRLYKLNNPDKVIEWNKKWRDANPDYEPASQGKRKRVPVDGKLTCTTCRQSKDISEFYQYNGYWQMPCKECRKGKSYHDENG